MGNTLVVPATMNFNNYVSGNSTIVGSTASLVYPTTATVYQVRLDQGSPGAYGDGGRVGVMVAWVSASSSGFLRIQVAGSASSDYIGWQGGMGMSTDVTTIYSPPTSIGLTAASSTEYILLGPFDSAKYGRLSTAGYKVMNITVDCAGTKVPQSSLSTTLSIIVSTIRMMAFQMP
jgi:hypothetical protein